MIGRYEAFLDNKSLSGIDPAVIVKDIAYSAAQMRENSAENPGRDGVRMLERYRESTGVSIKIEIHEYDIVMRQEIARKVQQWAQGRVLRTNDRPGQRLLVVCDELPVIGSALKWTENIGMSFMAYDPPFWEEERERTLRMTGAEVSGALRLGGNTGQAKVSAKIENITTAQIDTMTVSVGGTQMRFEALGLKAGEVMKIEYDEMGLLRITAGTRGAMNKRTAQSADDLLADSGKETRVMISADGGVDATFRARGRFL